MQTRIFRQKYIILAGSGLVLDEAATYHTLEVF